MGAWYATQGVWCTTPGQADPPPHKRMAYHPRSVAYHKWGVHYPWEGWTANPKRMAHPPGECGILHMGVGWCTTPGTDLPPQRGCYTTPVRVVCHRGAGGALPLGRLAHHTKEDVIPSRGAWHTTQGRLVQQPWGG